MLQLCCTLLQLRATTWLLLGLQIALASVAGTAAGGLADQIAGCLKDVQLAAGLACAGAGLAICWMIGAGWFQHHAANASRIKTTNGDEALLRKVRFSRWLLWCRLAYPLSALQLALAIYLTYEVAHQSSCTRKLQLKHDWLRPMLIAASVLAWLCAMLLPVLGQHVLSWRALYGADRHAWLAHYSSLFDRLIRDALCCLCRPAYRRASKEDDITSIAALAAELTLYRSARVSHLDLVHGMARLQSGQLEEYDTSSMERPSPTLLQEAAFLQPFAVAAYTGPVLDFARSPVRFCCTWPFRQNWCTPWQRNKLPALENDNALRGHAAAFLRYARVPAESLRQGRVPRQKYHCAPGYFVVVLHENRCVVVCIRGTETPEDLLTDALAEEAEMAGEDLGGLETELQSQAGGGSGCFAHTGVLRAARELAYQLDRVPYIGCPRREHQKAAGDRDCEASDIPSGLLTELLKPGGECEGYALRIAGHSLGGGIATTMGLRLLARYPQLRVFAFNTIPTVDKMTADACSDFTTSILYNNDWASRISLASVLRFRTAAVQAHLETRTPVTSRSKNPPRSSPATESESDATQVNPAETNQKFGFLGSIKRRLRQWQSIACVAQALLHVLCFLTLEKDRTKSRNVIFRDRERHKAGLDVSKTDQHFDTHSSRESNVIAAEIGNGASEATGEHEEGSLREAEEGRAGLTAQAMGETEACTSVQSEGGRGWVESDPDDESSAKSSAQIVFSEPLANGSAGAEAALPPSVVYAEESRKAVSGQCQETAGVGCSEDVTPSASPTEERPSMQSSLEDDPQKEDRGSGVKRSNKEGSSSAPVIQAMVQDNFKPREMYVPGTIVHVVRVREGGAWPILSSGRRRHVAVLADRAALRKVPVHPNTFLDHMPWRLQGALNELVEAKHGDETVDP